MKFNFKGLTLLLVIFALAGCNLDEELNSDLTAEEAQALNEANANVSGQLLGAYRQLRDVFSTQDVIWAAMEHTSDELIAPTRGPDWDDNGVWRVLHNHRWGAENPRLEAAFNGLLGVVFSTTEILNFADIASAQELAESRFLRAYAIFAIADGWGQVPVREGETAENLLLPPTVLSGTEAVDFVISELNEILPNLPDGPATLANKDAARALLMKAHLNRGIIGGKVNDGSVNVAAANVSDAANFNPAEFFAQEDMNRVVALANEIEASSRAYAYAANYFDNFAPDNDQVSTENIFTGENLGGTNAGNIRFQWFCTLHYNQNPSGWNGFTTLADFYNQYEEDDSRVGGPYDGITDVAGINVGFLVGQQFDANGVALEDRRGNPLAFTEEIDLQENGDDLEIRGIRVIKYPIDYVNPEQSDNDFVYLRFADVRLMKAEAILRGATNATESALDIVNELRQARGASALGSVALDELLAERGRELYWEGHRRTDQIRFGKFIGTTWDDKPASEPFRMLFPIPAVAVAVNPNLDQNPGY